MNRRERRAFIRSPMAKKLGLTWEKDSRFEVPVRRALPPVTFWKAAPWTVTAHVYSQCPTLFREWAGQLDKVVAKTSTMAQVLGVQPCAHCFNRWMQNDRR